VSVAAPDLGRGSRLDVVLARPIPAGERGPGGREAGAREHLERPAASEQLAQPPGPPR
jgi:hypothetical protein